MGKGIAFICSCVSLLRYLLGWAVEQNGKAPFVSRHYDWQNVAMPLANFNLLILVPVIDFVPTKV